MKSSLLAALALYAVAVVGIGIYVYSDPSEGIATMLGYSIAYMLVVAIVTLLSTRKSKSWTPSRRLTTVLLWTTGLLIAFHVRQVIDSYNFNAVRRELASASSPEQAVAMLQGSSNPYARWLKRLIESVNNSQASFAAIRNEIENDPLLFDLLLPSTLADPIAFESSRQTVHKRLMEMDSLRGRIEAVFDEMEANLKNEISTMTGIGDETRRGMSSGWERGMSNSRETVRRWLQLEGQMLTAIDTLHSFLVSRRGHYEVTDEKVLFESPDDVVHYNRLFGDVQTVEAELQNFRAESERKHAEWTSMRWLQDE